MPGPLGALRTAIDPSAQIATEHSPWAQTSTVGVWIDAGSRAETDKTNGTAHFLEHLAFKVRTHNGNGQCMEIGG
jgi:processing peptidase subunit beta